MRKNYKAKTSTLFLCFLGILQLSCNDSKTTYRNPYLQDVSFNITINTALPLYNALSTVGGSMYINNGGIRGILVINRGSDDYLAWEASCPNHTPSACSTMKIEGTTCVCSCENYKYSLFTGSLISTPPAGAKNIQGLLFYRATAYGGVISISQS